MKKNLTILIGGMAALLAVISLVVLRTDALGSPRKILGDGLVDLSRANARNIDLSFRTTQILGEGEAKKLYEISLNSKGTAERSGDKVSYDGTLNIKNHRPGLDMNFSFLLRSVNNTAFLNIKEIPGTPEINDLLIGKWLVYKENMKMPVKEVADIFASGGDTKILKNISKGNTEEIAGVRARKYSLVINQDELKKTAEALLKNEKLPETSRDIWRRVVFLSDNFQINKLDVWVTNYDHKIVRTYLVLIPKDEKIKNSSVVLDAKISPLQDKHVAIEVPKDAQKFENTKLLPRLVSVGLR